MIYMILYGSDDGKQMIPLTEDGGV